MSNNREFLHYFGNIKHISVIIRQPKTGRPSGPPGCNLFTVSSLFSIARHCEKAIPYSAAGASGTASFKGKLITSEREPSSVVCLVT